MACLAKGWPHGLLLLALLGVLGCSRVGFDSVRGTDELTSDGDPDFQGGDVVPVGDTAPPGDASPPGDTGPTNPSDATIVSAVVTSGDRDYQTDDVLVVEVTFSEPVTVPAGSVITVQIGWAAVELTAVGGGPGTTFAFTYTVQAGDLDLNGVDFGNTVDPTDDVLDATHATVVNLTFTPPDGSGITINAGTYVLSAGTVTSNTTTCLENEPGTRVVGTFEYRTGLLVDTPDPVPIIFFFHGAGESSPTYNEPLLTQTGLPQYVTTGNEIPYAMFAPQVTPNFNGGQGTLRKWALCILANNPRIDRNRVYVTGLSNGGMASWSFASVNFDLVAASAPIAGFNDSVPLDYDRMRYTPVWSFHGDADTTVHIDDGCCGPTYNGSGTRTLHNDWLAHPTTPDPLPKLTVFAGENHNIWNRIYDGTLLVTETPSSLYTWFDSHVLDPSRPASIAVPLAETARVQLEVDRASLLIQRMPAGATRTDYELRIAAVQADVLDEVDAAVTAAEGNGDSLYVAWAQRLVDTLPVGAERTAFQTRIDAITVSTGQRLLIGIGRWGNMAAPWIRVEPNDPTVTGTVLTPSAGFADESGSPVATTLTVTQAFTATGGGMASGYDRWLIPDLVLERAYRVTHPAVAILTLGGLTPSNTYDVSLMASARYDGTSSTRFTVQGGSPQLSDAYQNVTDVRLFPGVVADGSGQIAIQVEGEAAGEDGYLNLIAIAGSLP